jgi:hypothetical protein
MQGEILWLQNMNRTEDLGLDDRHLFIRILRQEDEEIRTGVI